jgi:Septum formation
MEPRRTQGHAPTPEPPPPTGFPPPPPPPPPPAPPFPPGRGPRQRRLVWPWVVGGLAVMFLVAAGVTALARRDDDGSTVVDAERDTTTSEASSTTTTSEAPSTTTTSKASSPTETGTVVFLDELRLGDCFNDSAFGTPEELAGEIRRVECASPHDAEVFALVTLPGEPSGSYPGDDEIFRLGDQLCRDQFASYVGIDYLDSMWEFGYYSPTEESWRKYDDRLVICHLGDPGFNKIEGSKRDSRT